MMDIEHCKSKKKKKDVRLYDSEKSVLIPVEHLISPAADVEPQTRQSKVLEKH